MKYLYVSILLLAAGLSAETLFQVKDSSGNPVMNVEETGMTLLNGVDTLMTISSQQIKAFIDKDASKGLSRSFTIASSDARKSIVPVFSVQNTETQMWEGDGGDRYMNFSPKNIFLGLEAGANTVPWTQPPTYMGTLNTFLGNYAGYSNTSGFGNIYIGYEAGYYTTTSNQNVYIGYDAGYNFQGQNNAIVGFNAAKSNGGSGDYNSIFGRAAGFSLGTAASNTIIGAQAGDALTNGNGNTLVGKDAGGGQSGAAFDYNTVVGSYAAMQLSTGDYNVILGYNAGSALATGSNNVFIGKQAGGQETGSDKLYIDNTNTTTPLIYGDFSTDLLKINGTLRVGTLDIGDLTNNNLGLDGDVVPFGGSGLGFDLGNNVSGEYWDDVVAQDFINYVKSDSKINAKTMDSGLEKVLKLRPVVFDGDRKRNGLLPEELETVVPEAVAGEDMDIDPETGEIKTVRTEKGLVYDQLIPVLIRSIQEQQEIIAKLENRISELENK